MQTGGGLFNMLSPGMRPLYALGMTGGLALMQGHWWTVLTATYLHGSFGSGKSHFMAVLHQLLQHHPWPAPSPSWPRSSPNTTTGSKAASSSSSPST